MDEKRFLSSARTQELINEIKRRDDEIKNHNPHWSGTKEELEAELLAGNIKEGTIIFITNDEDVVATHEVTVDEWDDIIDPIPATNTDSGSSGHIIRDVDDNSLTQRSVLKFAGDLETTDDSTSGDEKTIVTSHALTNSEMDEIVTPLPGRRKDGIVIDERGNEYVVGEYIQSDGKKKPIYRKIIPGVDISWTWDSNNAACYSADVSSLMIDIDTVITIKGWFSSNSSDGQHSDAVPIGIYFRPDGGKELVFVNYWTSPNNMLRTLLLEYTKTTDVAT